MKTRSLLFLMALAIPGCDRLFPGTDNEPAGSTTLKAFTSEQELKDYLRGEIAARNSGLADSNMLFNRGESGLAEADAATGGADGGGPIPAPAAPSSDPGATMLDDSEFASDFSQTTTQEVGVDEADVVKTDGRYIYLIDDSSGEHSTLRIVQATPVDQLAVLSETALDGYGREIYLHGGKIVTLTATYGGLFFIGDPLAVPLGIEDADTKESETGGAEAVDSTQTSPALEDEISSEVTAEIEPSIDFLPPYRYERPRVTATVIDVSDPSNPRILSTTQFDGSPASSRMIGGALHLVLANYQNYFFDVMPLLGRPGFDAQQVEPEMVLPRYEQTDAQGNVTNGDLITWQDVYRPSEPDGFGVVTVVSLDADNNSSLRATGIVAEPGMIYSSLNALYLTNTDYDFQGDRRTSTKIYKLGYSDGRAVPSSAGSVPGRILNQYSMGEHNGVLRVATTVDPVFSPEGQITSSHNNVYCLADTAGALEVIGRVENIAPRETIQSARFVGEKGFVVTFEQIDPLFTLDLSDPTNPRIVGELKVPGFSTFMVPIDENHLLAVGQYIPEDGSRSWGVQLSIFDVTDFAAPVQRHNVVLGDGNEAWSEALYDPKALTYFAETGLLALPINIYPRYEFFSPIELLPTDVIEVIDAGVVEVKPGSEPSDDTDVAEGSAGSGSGGSDGSTIAVGEPAPPVPQDTFEGLVVYRVSAQDGFTELGRIDTRFEQEGYYSWTSFTRGVFIEDDVYAVTNLGVRVAPVANVASVPFEIFYGQQYPIEPVPIDPILMDDGFVRPDGSISGAPTPETGATVDPAQTEPGANSVVPASSPAYNGVKK